MVDLFSAEFEQYPTGIAWRRDIANYARPDDYHDPRVHQAWWPQTSFMDERLPLLLHQTVSSIDRWPTRVVGTHRSKSCTLPVMLVRTDEVALLMRSNFHDWKLSVQTTVPVPTAFMFPLRARHTPDEYLSPCYFEGFQREWIFPAFTPGCTQFSLELYDDYEVYLFAYLLLQAIASERT